MAGRDSIRVCSIFPYYLRLTVVKGCSTSYVRRVFWSLVKRFGFEYKAVVSRGHGTKNFDRPHVHAIVLSTRSIDRYDIIRRIPDGVHVRFSRITSSEKFVEIDAYIDDHTRPEKNGCLIVSRSYARLVSRIRW